MSGLPLKIMRAAIYTRVSTDEQTHGTSLDEQRERCQQEAARGGWIVTQVYTNGHSGAAVRRAALDRLRLVAFAGAVAAVIVVKTDRLARAASLRLILVRECRGGSVGKKIKAADGSTTLLPRVTRPRVAVTVQVPPVIPPEHIATLQASLGAKSMRPGTRSVRPVSGRLFCDGLRVLVVPGVRDPLKEQHWEDVRLEVR